MGGGLKIAQVSPLYESVPPRAYGGTERVVSYLTEELVRRGHEVTLYASGDSVTTACLRTCAPSGLRLQKGVTDPLSYHVCMLETVYREAGDYDLVHFHVDYLHYPLFRRSSVRHVTTLHGRLDLPELVPLYREFIDVPLVSISLAQREPIPWTNWVGNVYHGIPAPGDQAADAENHDYLAFVGRLSPEKRLDRAVEIAEKAGMPLKVMAKVADCERGYFDTCIRHLLTKPLVEFLGEGTEREKMDLLAGALALLFPIDWPEPFGLVMVEAFSVGTPVVAYAGGAVREVVDEGVTGFVVDGIDDAVKAVEMCASIDRAGVRRVFEERFSVGRMVDDYLSLYETLAAEEPLSLLSGRRRSTISATGTAPRIELPITSSPAATRSSSVSDRSSA
jgi:glycosyltransferase involved in cell wall biosynthesis